eukprot:CAMPEP_0202959692 /NCGR_PEP_ID=MMETSP1396-20130829/3860_1 /ASSEMBLY_ACC=CAM_ASM_000872 /TAXON_ID= /ORGANISM="Pseudokeronopsis sp., Strain Brazil" /LENGTH=58 /DNA_ID=CAMNT_0049678385 /DNA_START=755 /DNA_END=931 /DNA_ORIENTATION=+
MVEMNGRLILFGGIIEITKESDEVFIFDPVQNIWKQVDTSGQIHEGLSPAIIPMLHDH